jgi:hypothetical protein
MGLDTQGRVWYGELSMPSYDRALCALRTWLDSWSGIGRVAGGMHRQGFDLHLPVLGRR